MLFAFETSTNFLSININYGKKNHNYCAIKNLSTYFKKFYYFQYQIDIFTYYPTLKINVNLLSTCKSNYAKIYETVQKYIPCGTQRNVIFET